MKKIFSVATMALVLLGFLMGFAETASALTYQDLETIYDTELGPYGYANIDGNFVDVYSVGVNLVEITVNGTVIGTTSDDRDSILMMLADYLGIPLFSAGSLTEPSSAAATTSRIVFDELVIPTVKTTTEKRREQEQKAKGGMRTFGAALRTEWVDYDGGENGRISGFNLGLAYDEGDYTYGVIIPYDYFDFDSFTANRIGSIFFGQYHLSLSQELEATFTANLNYMFTDFRLGGKDDDLNTYGGGLSVGLNYIQETYELGCGVSYQFNKDDVDLEDDEQHLIKTGANVGYRVTPDQVVNIFGTWNYDATDYKYDYGDDDYFEIGAEYRANFSETWVLNAGYRKVVDLDDYDSDLVYFGTMMQF
jgi:hypothetical protein